MHGDPTVIRHLAARLREQAVDVRDAAHATWAAAVATPWRGQAADAMRAGTRKQVAALEHTADLHDEAAARLLEHAARVEETQALIAAIEARAHALVGAARERISGVIHAVTGALDAADAVLDAFTPPPPGSIDWLTVELPGLHVPVGPWASAA